MMPKRKKTDSEKLKHVSVPMHSLHYINQPWLLTKTSEILLIFQINLQHEVVLWWTDGKECMCEVHKLYIKAQTR
jgi:hypothetical protein